LTFLLLDGQRHRALNGASGTRPVCTCHDPKSYTNRHPEDHCDGNGIRDSPARHRAGIGGLSVQVFAARSAICRLARCASERDAGALALNGALAGRGVYAGHVAIGRWIAGTPGTPEGTPLKEPDDIARLCWDLHTGREPAEHLISA
jgi:hypothetical protein